MTKIFKLYTDISNYDFENIAMPEGSSFYFGEKLFVFNIEVYINSLLLKTTSFNRACIASNKYNYYDPFHDSIIINFVPGFEYVVPNILDFFVKQKIVTIEIKPFHLRYKQEDPLFDKVEKELLVDNNEITFRIIYQPTDLNIGSMKKWIEAC
jgi:hypothetical protein